MIMWTWRRGLVWLAAGLLFSGALIWMMASFDKDWESEGSDVIGRTSVVVNVWSAEPANAKLIIISDHAEEVLYVTSDCFVKAGSVLKQLGEEGKLKCVEVNQQGKCVGHKNIAPDMAALIIFERIVGKTHRQYCIDRHVDDEMDHLQDRIRHEMDHFQRKRYDVLGIEQPHKKV